MSRNRVIYNSLALYASQVSATGQQTGQGTIAEIIRVQDFNEGFQRSLENILQYGNLAPIDRKDVEPPDVTANFTYYNADFLNEQRLGFYVTPSGSSELVTCISGILTQKTNVKNYYLAIADEGYDEHGYRQPTTGCIAVGNGYIGNYTLTASLGQVVQSAVDINGFNIAAYSQIDGINDVPAVDSNGLQVNAQFLIPTGQTNQYAGQISSIQPRDVILNLTGIFPFAIPDLKVTNLEINIPISLEPINKLGSFYPVSQQITFPVICTINVDAEFGDLNDEFDLKDVLCEDAYTLSFRFNKPSCTATGQAAMIIVASGCKLVNSDTTTAIGSNGTVSAQWEVAIGGITDVNGIYFSGSFPNGIV